METVQATDAIFLNASEGILVTNDAGEIVIANPSAERLFGYIKNELTGKKIENLVPERFSDNHITQREKYIQNAHPRLMGMGIELYGRKKSGAEFPVEISLSSYSDTGGNFVVAFIIDITQRKLAEEKLKNYSAELERQVRSRTQILEEAVATLEKTKKELHDALDKERELNELKTRFVSMASHEFRTPLTTIMSSLALIAKYGEQNNKENQQKHIQKIKTCIHGLTNILDDFLSVSKLAEGELQHEPETTNLKELITESVTEMRKMAKAGQVLNVIYSGNEIVHLDHKLLKNVIFHLISNAIKYSHESGTIEITTTVSDKNVEITIKDFGIGIPKEEQKYIFDRFFRGQNAIHIPGTGLGLNMVTQYAEIMGASVSYESEENLGTKFCVTIPL